MAVALGKFSPGESRGGTGLGEQKEGLKMPLAGTGRRGRPNLFKRKQPRTGFWTVPVTWNRL